MFVDPEACEIFRGLTPTKKYTISVHFKAGAFPLGRHDPALATMFGRNDWFKAPWKRYCTATDKELDDEDFRNTFMISYNLYSEVRCPNLLVFLYPIF